MPFEEPQDGIQLGGSFRPFFLENAGQLGGCDVLLYAQGDGMSVGFRRGGVVIVLDEERTTGPIGERASAAVGNPHVVEVLFEGCRDVAPVGVDEAGFPTNFLVGSDPSGWVRGARSFSEVVYEGLWDGVDLRYYFKVGMLKYDVVVEPGGRIGEVVMRYSGVEGLRVDPATGDLVIGLEGGLSMRDQAPEAFQEANGEHRAVGASFIVRTEDLVSFGVGYYDPLAPLVIDPGLLYSTYLGGAGGEFPVCLEKDTEGNVYVGAGVDSAGFPVTGGAYDRQYNFGKCLIVKLSPDLSSIVFATYFGGRHPTKVTPGVPTVPSMISHRPDGSVLVTGETMVDDLPTTADALQSDLASDWDSFVLALSADGSGVDYCSYFGGVWYDGSTHHRQTSDGGLYLVGTSGSVDLPTTPGAYGTELQGFEDVYIARLDPTYTTLLNCSYFGGSDDDQSGYSRSFDIDAEGNLLVTGLTRSSDLPVTPGAYCATVASLEPDAFVLKMDANLSKVLYCTYLGGSSEEWGHYISLLPNGTVVVAGTTTSDDMPVSADSMDDEFSGTRDGFVAVLDVAAPRLLYGTYVGGKGEDIITAAAFDSGALVLHVIGQTSSVDLPATQGCYNPRFSGGDAEIFVISIDLRSRSLRYCTYIGGAQGGSSEFTYYGTAMYRDADGSLLVVAGTTADDFPTTSGAISRGFSGGSMDGVLLRLDPRPVDLPAAPDAVSAVPGDGLVNLSWAPVVSESYVTTGYVVLRGDVPAAPDTVATVLTGGTYTDRTVVNGHKYYYRVAARNSAGVGPPSGAQEAVPMGVPSAPRDLSLTTGDGTVHLSWLPPVTTKGGQLLGYHVRRGDAPGTVQPIKLLGNVTSWTDVGVTTGERYYYQVVAFNERGNGTASEVVDVVVTSPPGAPVSFTVVAGPGRVDLAWASPANMGGAALLGYHVLRGLTADSMMAVKTTLPSEVSYVDIDVKNGTTYFYGVRAFTLVSEGPPAGPLEAIPYGPPGAPEGFSAMPGDGQVLLQWSPPANDGGRPVTAYLVFAGESPMEMALVATVTAGTSHYLSGLVNGHAISVAVAARNEMGEGPAGVPVTVTPYGLPSKPRDLAVAVGPEGVRLTWTAPERLGGASALRYRIERGLSATALAELSIADVTEHMDTTVQRGTVYHYRVLALSPVGMVGEPSETITVSVPNVPGTVVGLTAKAGDGLVRLSWDHPEHDGGAPVLNYSVLRGVGLGALVPLAVVTGNTTFVDEAVVNGQTYRYSVSAVNVMGLGAQTSPVEALPMDSPNAPWGLGARVDGSTVVLRWSAPLGTSAPVTGYVIYRGTSPDALRAIAEVGDVLEYSDGDVERGRTYHYRVAANSTVGEGDMSQPVKVTVGGGMGATMLLVALIVVIVVAITLAIVVQRHRAQAGQGGRGR